MGAVNTTKACILAYFFNWYPFSIYPDDPNDTTTFTGVTYEIFKETTRKYDICYQTRRSPVPGFGILLKNGSFNGAIGLMQRKEADAFLTPVAYGYTRFQAAKYSDFLYVDYYSILYPYPTAEPDLTGFVKPFNLQSWITILGVSVAALFSFWAMFKIIVLLRPRNYEREGLENQELHKASLWVLLQLVAQPTPLETYLTSVRVAVTFWILMVFIITNLYRSNLMAMLTTPKMEVPFETLEDTIAVPGIKINVPLNSLLQEMYTTAEVGSILNRFSKIANPMDFNYIKENVLLYERPSLKGVSPRIGGQSTNMGLVHKTFTKYGRCTLAIAKEKFIPSFLGLIFPEGSKIKNKFSRVITGMREGGILDYIFNSLTTNSTFCEVRKGQADANAVLRPLFLGDFYGVFAILGSGLALALGCFGIEMMVGKFLK